LVVRHLHLTVIGLALLGLLYVIAQLALHKHVLLMGRFSGMLTGPGTPCAVPNLECCRRAATAAWWFRIPWSE